MRSSRTKRPLGISLLSVLLGLTGIISIAFSFWSYLGYNTIFELPEISITSFAYVGSINVTIAYGLWNMKDWARTLLVTLGLMGIIFSIASVPILIEGNFLVVVGAFLAGSIVWYLNRKEIKQSFKGRIMVRNLYSI